MEGKGRGPMANESVTKKALQTNEKKTTAVIVRLQK